MRKHADRIKLANAIKARIPWASVVAGAPRCNFIRIDRGETIVGCRTAEKPGRYGYQGSAWSRPVVCSRYIEWSGNSDNLDICEYVPSPPQYSEGWKILKTVPAPRTSGKGWLDDAANALVALAEEWLRPVEQEAIDAQLRKGERFEIRIHAEVPA